MQPLLPQAQDRGLSRLLRRVCEVSPRLYEHGVRVARFGAALGVASDLAPEPRLQLFTAGLLHDFGEAIVLPADQADCHPERLRHGDLCRRHPAVGAGIARLAGLSHDVVEAIRWHHERVDGTGFPDKLSEPQIPHLARCLAVADTFASLLEGTPDCPAYTVEEAMEALACLSGSALDPGITAAFLDLPPNFLRAVRFTPLAPPEGLVSWFAARSARRQPLLLDR